MARTLFRRQRIYRELWDRAQVFSSTTGHGGWTLTDVSASGSPTAQIEVVSGVRCARLLLANTSEAELLDLHLNDVLGFPLRKVDKLIVMLKALNVDAVTTLLAGLGSARNSTADSVAVNAWARVQGAASLVNILAETDDGTTDKDDQDTGVDLSSDWFELMIDFSGNKAPDGAALKPAKFFINGNPVCEGVNFDLSGVSATQGVQPIFRCEKASGTGTPELCIGPLEIYERIEV